MDEKPLVRDLVKAHSRQFTPAERRVAPFFQGESLEVALQSITKLAEAAEVSTPTIVRFARKLGFDGFHDMQNAIRAELADRIKKPLAKLEAAEMAGQQDHILNRFAQQAVSNINRTLSHLDLAAFDDVTEELADTSKAVYLLGGRITRANAQNFFNHLQIIRPGVTLMDSSPNVWPQTLLDFTADTVLVLFDIRRYEKDLERLASLAVGQGARIILFTDQWGSPIEKQASTSFRAMVEAPSAWDSSLALNLIVEAMIAQIQKRHARRSTERIKTLEEMLGETPIFRDLGKTEGDVS